jgi:PAS domain S-box-containing protein
MFNCFSQYFNWLFGFIFIVFFSGSLPVLAADPSVNKPNEIIAATVEHFPPYFLTDKSGKPTGFSIDVLNEVAKRAGLKLKYQQFKHGGEMVAALGAGRVQVVPDISLSKSRKKNFLFTRPVSTLRISLFVRSDNNKIKSLDDLADKLIGVRDSKLPIRLLKNRGHKNIKIYKDSSSGLFGLLSGEVDAFVFPEAMFLKLVRKTRVVDKVRAVEVPIATFKRAIMVAKKNAALHATLDSALEEFLETEEFRTIYIKWFGTPIPFWSPLKIAALMGGLLLVIIAAMAAWRYRSVSALNRELKRSEDRYAFAVSGSQNGIWEWNIKTGEQYFSPRWFEILGYTDGELEYNHRTFENLLHPDDKIRVTNAIKAHIEEHLPFDIEHRLRRKDGAFTWVQVKGEAVWDGNRKPIRMAGSINDISIRKMDEEELLKSEIRFRSLIDSSNQGILVHRNFKPLYVNNALVEMYGYDSAEELMSLEDTDELTHPEFSVGDHNKRLEGESAPKDKFSIGVRKNGTEFWEDRRSFIIDWDGQPAVCSMRADISERKHLEAQLQRSQRLEAVGQLTGGVAHDFNNLLAIMLGNNEMLGDLVADDQEARLHVDAVSRAIDRASTLTNRLLAFSRQQALSPITANVTDLIGGLDDMIRRTLGETIHLKVEHSAELWSAIIDPSQFENALVNLAINARDAMPDGGILTIETANITLDDANAQQYEDVASGDYVRVAVSDTGTGMPPDVVEKVFEPFFTTKDVGKGSGLGLSMVYGFAKQSNGLVTIYSEDGHGTTVKLYMPRSEEAASQENIEEDKPELKQGSERILLIEDDEEVRKVSTGILRNQGYQVVEVTNGKEAIERFNELNFDLLFTDVVLPGGMNGVEIAEYAQRIQPNINVLYTTGYTENAVVHQGKLDPGVTLINKPYRRAELLEMVHTILDGMDE